MAEHNIVVLAGDHCGPEVRRLLVRALDARVLMIIDRLSPRVSGYGRHHVPPLGWAIANGLSRS